MVVTAFAEVEIDETLRPLNCGARARGGRANRVGAERGVRKDERGGLARSKFAQVSSANERKKGRASKKSI